MGPHTLNVTVKATIPGLPKRTSPDDYDSPFDAFFTEQHSLTDPAGEGGRGILDLLTAYAPGARIASGTGFGLDGVSCVTLDLERAVRSVAYRLHFSWNHAIGARSIRRLGRITVTDRPASAADRSCADQDAFASGNGGRRRAT